MVMKSDRWKKIRIMLVGKCKKIRIPNVSWIVFSICICLMVMMLFPQVLHRAPIYRIIGDKIAVPHELEIYGNIYLPENVEASVYVGGFSSKINDDGSYELNFLADTKEFMINIIDNEGNLLFYSEEICSEYEWTKRVDVNLK